MSDKFADWDTFIRHQTLVQDPHKALRWTRYEKWVEERHLREFKLQADLLATQSAVRAMLGAASKKTT